MHTKTFSVRQALRFGWDGAITNIWTTLGFSVVYLVINIVLSDKGNHQSFVGMDAVSFGMRFINALINIYLLYRLYSMGMKLYRGQAIHFRDLYEGAQMRTYVTILASSFLRMILVVPFALVAGLGIFIANQISVLLAILVGIVVTVGFFYYVFATALTPFAAISGKGAWDSIVESYHLSKGIKGKLLAYGFACVGVIILACIPLGLGLLIVFPMLAFSMVHIYLSLKQEPQVVRDVHPAHA